MGLGSWEKFDSNEGLTRQVGAPWAYQAMQNYFPKDEPPEPKYEDADDVEVHCARCRSTDGVFDELVEEQQDAKAEPKFQWTCAACGKKWQDEGVETKS